jgi:response regulator RpfG family c-di-GMP phosphodiesterase
VARTFELGATDYLVRPVEDDALNPMIARLVTESVERSWETLNANQKSALKMSLKSFEGCFDAARTGEPPPVDDIKESCRLVVDAVGADGVDACMKGDDLRKLALGGMLHDIGKSQVPLDVLDSPNRLDDDEWIVMRRHPEHSETILETMKDRLDPDIVEMAVRHHEKLDGTGYPYGLPGTDLSDLVRMTAIVDVYSGLIDKRSYKDPMSREDAFGILSSMDGHLDLELVGGFRRLMLD